MTEGPTDPAEQTPRRHKPGLDLPPYRVQQLRQAVRRIPWLIVGAAAGALCVQTWPGQTKERALLEIAKWVGAGLVTGLMADCLARRWLRSKV
jgi:hypothetical protein